MTEPLLLDTEAIKARIGGFFGDIENYLQSATLKVEDRKATGIITYQRRYSPIAKHTVLGSDKAPIVPGTILLESAARLFALLELARVNDQSENRRAIVREYSIKFSQMVKPGQKVVIELESETRKHSLLLARVKFFVDKNLVARAKITASSYLSL